jgi:glycosyltransferase involved in cell wall biosynthesis
MVATLRSFQPDLLQFEEPVFWPIVQRLQAEGHLKGIAIAHSSYNFETHAWRLRGLLGAPLNEQTLRDISTFEREIAAHCDVIFAVSEDDAHEFRSLGAKFVHVAENGVASLGCRARHPIDAYLPSRTSYALFVSSAHPPNAHGFIEMAARAHGHPLRDGELLICGRVGPMIQGAPRFLHTGRIFHRSRVLGWVDAEMLDALYAGTRVVILPKTHGGGSNLKTAEALASGRPIVATRQAFIGFERFMELPDIFVSDEPDTFWRRVNEHLAAPLVVESRSPEAMSGLLWSESLKSMVRAGEDAVLRVQQKRLTHVD